MGGIVIVIYINERTRIDLGRTLAAPGRFGAAALYAIYQPFQ